MGAESTVLMPVWAIFMLLVVFAHLAAGAVIIIGAIKMLRLQSYGWAMTASVLALLPCSPASLLGLAMGFWSLVVLNRRNVRAAFAENTLGPEYGPKGQSRSSPQRGGAWPIWALIVICLVLMCLIPPGAILAWRFFSRSAGSPVQQFKQGAPPGDAAEETMTIVTPQAAVAWEEFGSEIRVPVSHPAPIHVAYSLDGERLIAVIGEDLLTWADNGTLTSLGRKPIPNILPGAHFGSLPYGGETMTLARMDGTVELWDLASLQRLAQMRTGPVRCAAVSPDQQLAAVVGEDGTAKIWDVASDSERMRLEAPTLVTAIAFSVDGGLLAGAGTDGAVTLWEVVSGEALVTLRGYSSEAFYLSFSPDGRRLAAGAIDGTIAIWLVASGELEGTIKNPPGLSSIAFSPEGSYLVVGAVDGTVHRWLRFPAIEKAPFPLGPGRVHALRVAQVPAEGDDPFLSLALQGSYVYLIQGNVEKPKRLQVVDISNTTMPRIVGSCPVAESAMELAISGKHVCVLAEPKLQVFDMGNPSAPREAGSCDLGEGLLWDIAIEGKFAYITDVSSVRVIDLENPAAPKQVGRCELEEAQGIAVAGEYAYVACNIEGLHILDISDPAVPREIGVFDGPQGAADVAVKGDYAYIAGGEDGVTLWIADVSDRRGPESVGRYGDWIVGSIAVEEDRAVLGGEIVDVSNPAAPVRVGEYPGENAIGAGNYLYVADGAGFSIFRLVRNNE